MNIQLVCRRKADFFLITISIAVSVRNFLYNFYKILIKRQKNICLQYKKISLHVPFNFAPYMNQRHIWCLTYAVVCEDNFPVHPFHHLHLSLYLFLFFIFLLSFLWSATTAEIIQERTLEIWTSKLDFLFCRFFNNELMLKYSKKVKKTDSKDGRNIAAICIESVEQMNLPTARFSAISNKEPHNNFYSC